MDKDTAAMKLMAYVDEGIIDEERGMTLLFYLDQPFSHLRGVRRDADTGHLVSFLEQQYQVALAASAASQASPAAPEPLETHLPQPSPERTGLTRRHHSKPKDGQQESCQY